MASDSSSGSPTGNSVTDAAMNPGDNPVLSNLLADPETQKLMASMLGSGPTSAQPMSLADALIGSAYDVTTAPGSTKPFVGNMPNWIKSIAPQFRQTAAADPGFDPFLGVISQQGDERVYVGSAQVKKEVPIPGVLPTHTPMSGPGEVAGVDSTAPTEHRETKTKKVEKDKTLTTTQALNLPYTWSDEEVTDAMKKMRQAGINVTTFDMGDNSLVNVWQALVNRAAMTYMMSEGDNKVTPWDVLDMYKSEAKAAGTLTNYQNGTATQVNRTVSDVTEGEAWSVMQQTLSRMLGRDPSDQEIRDYAYRMNQLAAQNPSISKTIAHYKNGEVVSQDTKVHQGFGADDMAQAAYEDAQSNPEYGAYQAASLYFNSALSALGAIGG